MVERYLTGWQEIEYEKRYSHSYMDALPDFVALAEACEADRVPEAGACDTRAVWRRHAERELRLPQRVHVEGLLLANTSEVRV